MLVKRAAKVVRAHAQKDILGDAHFAEIEFHGTGKNHKTTSFSLAVFETDDGRTLAGADASPKIVFVFFIFFETAVRHPAVAARFTGRETARRARERIQFSGGCGKRDSGAGERAALARFSLPPPTIGAVSDECAATAG